MGHSLRVFLGALVVRGLTRPVADGQTWSVAPAVVKGRHERVVSHFDLDRGSDHRVQIEAIEKVQ
jgi:hypothetical protein